ncbi:MAG: branched-chain amino acid aminotransferase, partial [Thermodesulfobacteriota bacterium]|nr:branched-chain amino acid aminotransferase [Thermodesulfobacteriota bacterium]
MATVPRNREGSVVYDEDKLGFGNIFADHMLTVRYSSDEGGWQEPQIGPVTSLNLHPASMVLHYGQQV